MPKIQRWVSAIVILDWADMLIADKILFFFSPSLGAYTLNLRQIYRRMNEGKCTPMDASRIERLNALGFKWDLKQADLPKVLGSDDEGEERKDHIVATTSTQSNDVAMARTTQSNNTTPVVVSAESTSPINLAVVRSEGLEDSHPSSDAMSPVKLSVKTPAKPKSSKKKKQRAKRDSLAPPSSRRRSDRLNIIRQQVETLLGVDETMETSKIERAIIELKLDKLESLLSTDDTTAAYWAIAGMCFYCNL